MNRREMVRSGLTVLGAGAGMARPFASVAAPPEPVRTKPMLPVALPETPLQRVIGGRLEELRKEHRVPALLASVFVRGKLYACGAAGVRRWGTEEDRVTPSDRLMVGSISKPMTCTLMAALVERGILGWETTIRQVFPELIGQIRDTYLDAMLFQFLCHRAGISRAPGEFYGRAKIDSDSRKWRYDYVRQILSQDPVGRPGEKQNYASGHSLAAAMAEKVTGENYESLMKRYVFDPSGMAAAGVGNPILFFGQKHAHGHFRNAAGDPELSSDSINYYIKNDAAGGLHCTILDLGRFGSLHSVGEARDTGVLRRSSFEALHTQVYDHDGALLGWFNDYDNDAWWFRHGGSTGLGDQSMLYVAPESQIALAAYTNMNTQHGGDRAVDAVIAWLKAQVRPFQVARRQGRPGPEWDRVFPASRR
jgi:CubicO group peptidase (beta-lactamase class C family)